MEITVKNMKIKLDKIGLTAIWWHR